MAGHYNHHMHYTLTGGGIRDSVLSSTLALIVIVTSLLKPLAGRSVMLH